MGVSTARFNYSVCQPVILHIFGLFVFCLTGKLGSCNLRQGTAEISTNKRINYNRPKGYVVCSWRLCCFQNTHSLFNLFPQQLYAFGFDCGGSGHSGVWIKYSFCIGRYSAVHQIRTAMLSNSIGMFLLLSLMTVALCCWVLVRTLRNIFYTVFSPWTYSVLRSFMPKHSASKISYFIFLFFFLHFNIYKLEGLGFGLGS